MRHETQYHTHIHRRYMHAVKINVMDVEVGASTNVNPRQDQVTGGSRTVLDLLTTKALVL